jgi:hypothetical protein
VVGLERGLLTCLEIFFSNLHGDGLGLRFVAGDQFIDELLFVALLFREQAPHAVFAFLIGRGSRRGICH